MVVEYFVPCKSRIISSFQ